MRLGRGGGTPEADAIEMNGDDDVVGLDEHVSDFEAQGPLVPFHVGDLDEEAVFVLAAALDSFFESFENEEGVVEPFEFAVGDDQLGSQVASGVKHLL